MTTCIKFSHDCRKTVRCYNPGQNCWDNSRFSTSPNYNADFSRSPKSRSVHRSRAYFNIVWGKGRREKGSEKRITMEACTANSLLFAQNLTSVPNCFDPHCSCLVRPRFPVLTVWQHIVKYGLKGCAVLSSIASKTTLSLLKQT